MYKLDATLKTPLHIQLYKAIKDDIVTNYSVGEKLPSIRKVASLYNISKTTVESAYTQLYAEGVIDSQPKRGYFVADIFYMQTPSQNRHNTQQITQNYKYDFFPAQLKKEDFPQKIFKRLCNKVLSEDIEFGAYGDGQGEKELREAIAHYLQSLRGVQCSSKQIVICSGFSDAMGLLAKLLRKKYTHFGMEEPGYHVARKVFQEYGYKIEPIAVTHDGVSLEALQNAQVKLLYTTPSHHYPTGVSIPLAKRLKLLEYSNTQDGLIIEDDYDSELVYYNRSIPSLQGLDTNERVVYIGTFAKSLSPALRVSYMVLPTFVLELYKQSYDAHFPRVDIITQKTLALFMQEGHWERHLRKIRTLNKKKHHHFKQLLQKYLKDTFTIKAEGAGLAILIYPKEPSFDLQKLQKLAENKGIKLYLAKERSGGNFEALRMGFGGFGLDELEDAVREFAEVWERCLEKS